MEYELNKIKPFVDKFTLSSYKLNMILRDQKAIFDKVGLGFNSYVKQKSTNNLYRKSINENMSCYLFQDSPTSELHQRLRSLNEASYLYHCDAF